MVAITCTLLIMTLYALRLKSQSPPCQICGGTWYFFINSSCRFWLELMQ